MKELFLRWIQIGLETGVFLLLLLLLSRWLRDRYPVRRICLLWGMIALRLLIPVRLEVTVSLPQGIFPSGMVGEVFEETAQPEVFQIAPEEWQVGEKGHVVFPSTTEVEESSADPLAILAGIWLGGAGMVLFLHFFRYFWFLHQVKRWEYTPKSEGVRSIYERVCREMKIYRPPQLCICRISPGPMVAGMVHTMLILPSEEGSPQVLEAVFRHELVHFRRRDLWYKLLMTLVCSIHWYHPLVWMMARVADRDLELACDSEVVQERDMEGRRQYSIALLDAIREQRKGSVPMSTRFYQGKRELKRRFANILDQRPRKRGNLLLCATLTVAIICGAWTGCSVKEAPEDKSSQSSAVENRIRLSALYQYKMDSMETEPYESNIPIISLISELPTEGLELMEVDYSADGGKSIRIRYRITDPEKVYPNGVLTQEIYYRNAAILLSLVQSLEEVKIEYAEEDEQSGTVTYSYSYQQDLYPMDLKVASSTQEAFTQMLSELGSAAIEEDLLQELYEARTEYIGNASAVGKLLFLLPEISHVSYEKMELSTEAPPYGLTLYYRADNMETALENKTYSGLYLNAGLLLSLIQNLEKVEIQIRDPSQQEWQFFCSFTPEDFLDGLKEASQSQSAFLDYWTGESSPFRNSESGAQKEEKEGNADFLRSLYGNSVQEFSDREAVEHLLSFFSAPEGASYDSMEITAAPTPVLWMYYSADRTKSVNQEYFYEFSGMLLSLIEDLERVSVVVNDGKISEICNYRYEDYFALEKSQGSEEDFVEYWNNFAYTDSAQFLLENARNPV